jgi:hypothetical protein
MSRKRIAKPLGIYIRVSDVRASARRHPAPTTCRSEIE